MTKKINSRQKGARGERQWRDELRANGYAARRGQQFAGGPDSPDVVCPDLPFHFEVKAVERLSIEEAMDQARRDAGGKLALVAHKRNHRPWLVTMLAEDWFKVVRGDFAGAPANEACPAKGLNSQATAPYKQGFPEAAGAAAGQ